MATRRSFLSGILALGVAPRASWADIGNPAYLSAARMPDGAFHLIGLGQEGQIAFSVPLPARGHAGAAHPTKAEATVFARRPGVFALAVDCQTGATVARFSAPQGRHFFGHGVYSADGSVLYTTENDYGAARGVIGVWDCDAGYTRLGEFSSGGIGPHEIARLAGTDTLVVANGGIQTHPDSGRAKLNIATMRPNLSYVSASGDILDRVVLGRDLRLNSIRHIAVRSDGLVAFGMQWQGGNTSTQPLLGFHRLGARPMLAEVPENNLVNMRGYVGSVSFSNDGHQVAISSPKGGEVQLINATTMAFNGHYALADVCGIGKSRLGFVVTTGNGDVIALQGGPLATQTRHKVNFDNHMAVVT